jgi:GMP synthase-like glutamine amidotransferase
MIHERRRPMPRACVLQHIRCEPPGLFSGLLRDRGGDTFGIPAGAVHLGQSAAYPNQALRFGEAAYAVQFHVEVTNSMLAGWRGVPAYQRSVEAVLGADGFQRLAAAFAAARASMARTASEMFTAWLDLVGRIGRYRGVL